ncbi:MAG: hypothetical protein JW959_08775 [Pirellulales bacterium]|nr:hypothetical protein [Pirellulales bacterium]
MPLFETVTDLELGAERLLRRRYGLIEVVEGRFHRVLLRPLPKLTSLPGVLIFGGVKHRRLPGDRIRIYYNRPRRFPNFLVLKYAESARRTSFGTLARALAVLDEIARLTASDALLCDVSNGRISGRLMSRWGWEPHCRSRFHRHYIKRFYGEYPAPSVNITRLAAVGTTALGRFSNRRSGGC